MGEPLDYWLELADWADAHGYKKDKKSKPIKNGGLMNSLFDKAAKLAAAVAAPVFQYREWTWYDPDFNERIPSVKEIRNTISDLLKDAVRAGYSSTGRLTVERDDCEDGTPCMYNIMLDIGTVFCDDDGEPENVEVD
jgi:hypothetical protein